MDAARIPLRNRGGEVVAHALVDEADYEWAMQWRWCRDSVGYAKRGITRAGNARQQFRLHRELVGLEHGDARQVDHINGDRLDNRRANLRVVDHRGNTQNIHGGRGSSSYRGVGWHGASRKWRAYALVDGRTRHLGVFEDEAEAARVVADFRRQHMPYTVEL